MTEREKRDAEIHVMWVGLNESREKTAEARRRWQEIRAALEYARQTYDVRISVGFTEDYNLREVPAECPRVNATRDEDANRYEFGRACLEYLEQYGEPWSPARGAAATKTDAPALEPTDERYWR